MSRRTDRIADLLRAELSTLLLVRVRDPRVKMTTVSAVQVSPDLRHARVRLSILGDDEVQRAAALTAVRHARGFLRSELARRLTSLKVVPELLFELDRGAEQSQRIHDLLESIKDEQPT